jgi:glycosyltransferase involved in cell wall biosynthesis
VETLSVVIPTWSATPILEDMAYELCKQVRPMCDELVVSEDGPVSPKLESIADKYLIHKWVGHGENLSLGIQNSGGHFVAILDSDIVIEKGVLRDLCIPDKVVYPQWNKLEQAAYFQINPDQKGLLFAWFVVASRHDLEDFLPFGTDIALWNHHFRVRTKSRSLELSTVVYSHPTRTSIKEYANQRGSYPSRVPPASNPFVPF